MTEPKIQEFISEANIKKRVNELAQEITQKFKSKEVIATAILKGSFMFFSDIVRAFDFDLKYDFVELSSYKGDRSSKNVKIVKDFSLPIKDKHVIIIEDIIETGHTIALLQELLKLRKPASITTIALLHKPTSQKIDYKLDYFGFDISKNGFVVGYGLDYNNQYRNLPYLAEIQSLN